MTDAQKKYYLSKFKNKLFVVKIGGEVVASKEILENILKDLKELIDFGIKIVLVHGGGSQADSISKQLGYTPKRVNGRRVTHQDDLEVVKMLYGGTLNIEILGILMKLSLKGMRVSGLDGALLKVKLRSKKEFDYGFVGDIVSVDSEILHHLLDKKYLPIVSPLGATDEGIIVNINADTIAAELAIDLKAEKLILFTNTDGIYEGQHLFSALTADEAEQLIDKKVVTEGMKVKVENSVAAVKKGVKRVHILNGLSPHSLLKEVLTKEGIGTMILSDAEKYTYLDE
ncbi:MAG: acetylglutamate kinase [Candidatus Gracilibacteria bacterium]